MDPSSNVNNASNRPAQTDYLAQLLSQDLSPVALIQGDGLKYKTVNASYLNLYYLPDHKLIGRTIQDTYKKQGGPDLLRFCEEALRSGKAVNVREIPVGAADGIGKKYFDFFILPLPSTNGGGSDLLIQGHNVTDLVGRTVSAEKNENLLQGIMDALPVLISYVDKNKVYRYNNKAYETWFGHSRVDVYGKQMSEVLGEEAYRNLLPNIEKALAGETVHFQTLAKYKEGGAKHINATYVPHFDKKGEVLGFYVEVADDTEQQRANDAIRESEERFRLMADASPVMIWTLDENGNSTYYNTRALEFTGHTAEDLQSGKSWQMAIHPDDIAFAQNVVKKAVETLKPYQMECRMQRADGEWRWLLNHGMPRLNRQGELVGYVGSSVDITERKQAEQALRSSEERYQNFIRQSTEGIWRFELKKPMAADLTKKEQLAHFFEHAYLAECNDAMAQMYGYTHSKELINFTLSHFFEKNDETEAYFNHFIDSGYRLQNVESKELDRHGHAKWFSNSLVGISENGHLMRAWGTQRDITAQKQAEEKLAASEKYFRELTETIPAILWITRPDGYCTYLNKNWYEYTGQTPGEAEGFGWLNATHPDDAKEAERLFVESTTHQKPYYILYRLKHRDGSYRWAIDSGQPKYSADGHFDGMIGTVIDVHEQKIAENKIKVSEEKFRTLAESLPQLVWMTDEHGNQEYASSRWKEFTGIDPSGPESWQLIVHPADLPMINDAWQSSRVSGEAYRTEARLKSRTGEFRWHFAQGEPIKDKNGRISKWIGSFTDIHDQKTRTTELETIVAERTKELKRSNEDLQQFAHVASHDLKEPVRKIKTYINRLEHEDLNKLSDASKTYIGKVQMAANRMSTMIDGVLSYSTVNAYNQPIAKVDLSKIVEDIKADLELVIQKKMAVISQQDLPVVEGAEVLLYQLFYNLINNSLKFTRTDVPVTVFIKSETITAKGILFAQITIEDNGIGFENKQAEKIFGTFERLNPKDQFDGTGLGLALSKKIAERHGGSIRAQGKPDKGAIFTLLLPVSQPSSNI